MALSLLEHQAMLMKLPAGFWLCSLVSDLIYLIAGLPVFAAVSFILILSGLSTAVLAALFSRPRAWGGLSLRLAAFVLFLINFFARYGLRDGVPAWVTPGELTLTALAAGLLVLSYRGAHLGPYRRDEPQAPARTEARRAA